MNAPIKKESNHFTIIRIHDVLIDPLQLELRAQSGQTLSLQQKPLEVLLYLISQHPKLVTRAELIEHVWNGNVYVGEKALTNVIWQIRTSFEKLGVSDVILTVRKRGYRLGIEPEVEDEPPKSTPVTVEKTAPHSVGWLARKHVLLAACALIVLLIAGGLWAIYSPSPESTSYTAQSERRQFTSGLGRAQFAALSPDGSKLAYVWRPFGDTRNIYIQNLDEPGVQQQLTFSQHRKTRLAWHHSGRYIVYPRESTDSSECTFVALDIVTRNEQELTDCLRSAASYIAAHPFRDEFYFSGRTRDGSNIYRMTWQNDMVDVSVVPCIQYCDYPVRDISISPDGRYIALTRRIHRFSEDLFVRDMDTNEEWRLTDDQVDIIGIQWHPDNSQVVMATIHSGKRKGYLVNIYDRQRVALNIENFGSPSRVSDDGTVYFHTVESQVQLSYLNISPDSPSALFPLTLSDYHYRDPHFNRATGQFTFVSNRSGFSELWVADASLNNVQKMTNIENIVRHPRWSHDGKYIAFVTRFPDERYDVLSLLDVQTGRLRRLHEFSRVLGRPTWWHDDSAIIVREGGNLHLLTLDSGEMTQLTTGGAIYAQSTADGSLYFTRSTNRGLWRRNTDGDSELVIPPEQFSTRYSWVATDAGVYFYNQEHMTNRLSFYSFSDETVSNVLSIPPELVTTQSTFAYDAAGSRLIIESWQARSTVVGVTHPLLLTTEK